MAHPLATRYPATRHRRLRQAPWVRDMVQEVRLAPSDLIWPLIVHDKPEDRTPVASMPGVDRLNIKTLVQEAKAARDLGIPALALFPNLDASIRDAKATAAFDPNGLIPTALKAVKDAVPDIGLIVDIALDPYTDHGHDGLIEGDKIVNDASVEALCKQALLLTQSGADIVAPSDMMDGRCGAIRAVLESEGYQDTLILSYAAKFASAFYGPYRDAIGVQNLKGDKKTYQMNAANAEEALREVAQDIHEGADMVMVKPGLPYLDIVSNVSREFGLPTFAYQVSGEYAMMMASIERGWMDKTKGILETLLCFKRAGAAGVLTYFAKDAAKILTA